TRTAHKWVWPSRVGSLSRKNTRCRSKVRRSTRSTRRSVRGRTPTSQAQTSVGYPNSRITSRATSNWRRSSSSKNASAARRDGLIKGASSEGNQGRSKKREEGEKGKRILSPFSPSSRFLLHPCRRYEN